MRVSSLLGDRFLLEPLQRLHEKRGSSELHGYHVLILLDAMDEADNAGKGWEAITMLVAYE